MSSVSRDEIEKREQILWHWKNSRNNHAYITLHAGRNLPLETIERDLLLWEKTLEHFQYKCAYCQIRDWQEIDHFLPRSKGGKIRITNLVPACHDCNHEKDNKFPQQFVSQSRFKEILEWLQNLHKQLEGENNENDH